MNSKTDNGGSPRPDVRVGTVGRAHGLEGFAVIHPDTDDPHRLVPGARFHTREGLTLRIARTRRHGDEFLASFEGYPDRGAVESLREVELLIASNQRRALREDEYWPDELVGLEVRSHDGVSLGTVADVVVTGVQDRLVVRTHTGTEVEVPFVFVLVPVVKLDKGYLEIAGELA